MTGEASSTATQIYMQTHEETPISTTPHPPKIWEVFKRANL